MIGGGDYQTVAAQLLDEDEKAIEKSSHFSHVACEVASVADAVELIEEIDGTGAVDGFEDDAELRKGLAEVAGDEAVESDDEEREGQLIGKGTGGHGFAAARRPGEEEPLAGAEAVFL